MEVALYHPEHGYYRRPRDPFGKHGDFFTAEQLQPVFGILIAARIRQLFREMGEPAGFHGGRAGRRPRRNGAPRSPNGATSLSISIPAQCPRTSPASSSPMNSSTRSPSRSPSSMALTSANNSSTSATALSLADRRRRPSRDRGLSPALLSAARSGPLV